MSYALVYDTETTGLPIWREPSEGENQPHVVQLAAELVDLNTRKVAASIDLVVHPNGWTIPQETIDVHGITNEYAESCGIPEPLVLECFIDMWRQAEFRVGHNERFDARIIRIAQHRFNSFQKDIDDWKSAPAECTGLLAKPIMQMPPKGRFGYKMPKLGEAYEHFFGRPSPRQSHTAMGDCQDCREIYFATQAAVDNKELVNDLD